MFSKVCQSLVTATLGSHAQEPFHSGSIFNLTADTEVPRHLRDMYHLLGAWGDRLSGIVSTWKILEASWMQLSSTFVHHALAAWARARPLDLAGTRWWEASVLEGRVTWLWHHDPLWPRRS